MVGPRLVEEKRGPRRIQRECGKLLSPDLLVPFRSRLATGKTRYNLQRDRSKMNSRCNVMSQDFHRFFVPGFLRPILRSMIQRLPIVPRSRKGAMARRHLQPPTLRVGRPAALLPPCSGRRTELYATRTPSQDTWHWPFRETNLHSPTKAMRIPRLRSQRRRARRRSRSGSSPGLSCRCSKETP